MRSILCVAVAGNNACRTPLDEYADQSRDFPRSDGELLPHAHSCIMSRFIQAEPTSNKHLNALESPKSSENEKPFFCLSCVQDGYTISECTSEQRATYANKLSKWAQMTWVQLRQADRHGLGYEKNDNIQVLRPAHVAEDATLIAFRFHGPLPVIGFRRDRVFYAVWFDRDPKGSIYRH